MNPKPRDESANPASHPRDSQAHPAAWAFNEKDGYANKAIIPCQYDRADGPAVGRAARAQVHHDGTRGVAIMSPLDSPDTDQMRGFFHHPYGLFVPYYGSPLTPISTRWAPVVYVPYYCGYHRPHVRFAHVPYGWDGDGLPAPGAVPPAELTPSNYGPYSGAPHDQARLLRLSGNAPYQPSAPGAIDFIDLMQGPPPGPGGPVQPEAVSPSCPPGAVPPP